MSKQGATPKEPSNSMATFAKILVGFLIAVLVGLFLYLLNPSDKKPNVVADDIVKPKQTQTEQPEYDFYELLPEQQVTGVPTKPIASQIAPSTKPDAVVTGKQQAKSQKTDDNKTDTVNTDKNPNSAETDNPMMADVAIENPTDNPILSNKSQLEIQTSKKVVIVNSEPSKTYILQINSFDNADEADTRRAEVLMAGVDAQIVKKRLDDGSMLYQVISRQMPNNEMATQAQRRLQNSGIDSLIVEQRRK